LLSAQPALLLQLGDGLQGVGRHGPLTNPAAAAAAAAAVAAAVASPAAAAHVDVNIAQHVLHTSRQDQAAAGGMEEAHGRHAKIW
jgi:hypothetical protein